MLSKEKISKIKRVFDRYAEIKAVYLFGSRATGTANQKSDFDLACYSDNIPGRSVKLEILKDLTAEGFDHIDLVMLAKVDPVIRYEAVRLNRLIYSDDDFDRGEIYSKIIREYLDLQPYFTVQREVYKQKKLYAET